MIRDYWVYQQNVDEGSPWALYIVKEYEKNTMLFSELSFDVTFYHDSIPNDMKSHSVLGITGHNADMVTAEIEKVISQHVKFNDLDRRQVKNALLDIATDTKSRRRSSYR